MRILFLSHYFPPEGNAPASRTYETCKRWAEMGHDVTVVTCFPNVPEGRIFQGYRNRLRKSEIIDGISVIRLWTFISSRNSAIFRFANFLVFLIFAVINVFSYRKQDIVVASSPQLFCGLAGSICSLFIRKPFVLEVRDIWPESILSVEAMPNNRIIAALEWLEHVMYRSADHIVTVGEGYKFKLIEKGVPEDKISIVMNGIDTDLFSNLDNEMDLREELCLGDKFVCSYVGTIGMACGLDIVIRAASLMKEYKRDDVVFLLIGDGAMRERLQMEACALGLSNILFMGFQPKNKIPDLLNITDTCFVHLKNAELFQTVMPSKIFEASFMKKPIINGVSGFAAQYVEKMEAGINIEPENHRDLIEAILFLQDNPNASQQFGLSGHKYVTKHNNRQELSSKYVSILI